MKKLFFMRLAVVFFAFSSVSFAEGLIVQEKWNTQFHPTRTYVGNSGVAASWYKLTGSESPRKSIYGNTVQIKAFRIYDANYTYAFRYSFQGSTPTANTWGTWHREWGPYENRAEPPRRGWFDGELIEGGVWVSLVDSVGNTTEMVFEAK